MAKPNPSFQKRMRERKKQERREEKERKKAERIAKGEGQVAEFTELKDMLGFDDDEETETEEGEEKED